MPKDADYTLLSVSNVKGQSAGTKCTVSLRAFFDVTEGLVRETRNLAFAIAENSQAYSWTRVVKPAPEGADENQKKPSLTLKADSPTLTAFTATLTSYKEAEGEKSYKGSRSTGKCYSVVVGQDKKMTISMQGEGLSSDAGSVGYLYTITNDMTGVSKTITLKAGETKDVINLAIGTYTVQQSIRPTYYYYFRDESTGKSPYVIPDDATEDELKGRTDYFQT